LDALKVSDAVENIRQNWPYLFTEKSTQSLFRAVMVLVSEAEYLHDLGDLVPFCVPESLDIWLLFAEYIELFMEYVLFMLRRKASFDDVQSPFSKFVMIVRFMFKLERLEEAENSIFSF